MAARIVSLAHSQPAPAPIPLGLPDQVSERQHVWRGASGRGYVHSVYGLIECPPLPKSIYLLVRRGPKGERTVLHVGIGQDEAPTLNLARVRQRGAQLGANEVHLHLAAGSEWERSIAACDLRAARFGGLSSEPDRASA